jgi:hypothetical protein
MLLESRRTMDPHPEPAVEPIRAFIDDPPVVFRRAAMWTLLCSVSAVPSFIVARRDYSRPAMVTGIAFFVVLYTVATSTQFLDRFSRRPFVRRTFHIGYGVRLTCSVLFPLGMMIDLFPGFLSVSITEGLYGSDRSFVPTLVTTLIHGSFLNIILGIFMLVVYGLQRAFLKPPPRNDGRCEQCGYDLRASYEFGRCPECGTPCTRPAVQGPERATVDSRGA